MRVPRDVSRYRDVRSTRRCLEMCWDTGLQVDVSRYRDVRSTRGCLEMYWDTVCERELEEAPKSTQNWASERSE